MTVSQLTAVCFENVGKEDLLKQGQAFAVESQVINITRIQSWLLLGKQKILMNVQQFL